jgi:hypothetical protein
VPCVQWLWLRVCVPSAAPASQRSLCLLLCKGEAERRDDAGRGGGQKSFIVARCEAMTEMCDKISVASASRRLY